MRVFKIIVFAIFLAGSLVCAKNVYSSKKMDVVFLNPGGKGDLFFDMMVSFMQAAANDLEVDLEVIYCDRSHVKMRNEGAKLLARKRLPEYLLLINENNVAPPILAEADAKGINVLLFNEGFIGDDALKMGIPREKFKFWIGELLPDDYQAGYLLAKTLIEEAMGVGSDKQKVNIVGLAGGHMTNSSIQRVKGLRAAVAEYSNVELKQIAPAHWEQDRATKVTTGLLKRYPNVDVVWAASDGMALGAVDSITGFGKEAGKDMYTGGVDWAAFAFDKVKDGIFTSTVGGHFMDGAWALIMAYDYHNGKDFAIIQAKSQFSALTKKNISAFLNNFGDFNWDKVDFKKFSKIHNESVVVYDFGLDAVLAQVEGN